jgi:hypothetical protein
MKNFLPDQIRAIQSISKDNHPDLFPVYINLFFSEITFLIFCAEIYPFSAPAISPRKK